MVNFVIVILCNDQPWSHEKREFVKWASLKGSQYNITHVGLTWQYFHRDKKISGVGGEGGGGTTKDKKSYYLATRA